MSLRKIMLGRRVRVDDASDFNDKTVFINRVSKVVKGGRRFSFSALVVTGDGKGLVGFGMGKATEVPEAIRKASENARRNVIKVPLRGSTITHDVMAHLGSCQIVMKPAAPGTGVIAGSVVRAVVEACGIRDIRTKCIGSNNPNNVLQAVFLGLLELKEPEAVAAGRGIALEELSYAPY